MFGRFIVIFLILAAVFVVGQSRLLAVSGVNPNLLLVFFLFLVFNVKRLPFVFVLGLSLAFFVFFFTPQWAASAVILLGLVLIFSFLRRVMTGTRFFDFIGLVLAGTFIFYFATNVFRLPSLPFAAIFSEALYNLVLGTVIWSIFSGKEMIHA